MIGVSDVLWGGVFPAIVAAGVLAIVWSLTHRAASAWRTALVAGYLAGHWALDARNIGFVPTLAKCFRATEAHHWLPLLLLLAIVPDAVACVGRRGPLVGTLLRIALCIFVPWRLLHGSKYLPLSLGDDFGFDFGGWSPGESVAWLGGIAALLLLVWQSLRCVDQKQEVLTRSILAPVIACGAAFTTVLSASIVFGQLLGVLAAALAGCGFAAVLLKTQRAADAAAGPLVIAYGSLLALAHLFAELKIFNGLFLLVAMAAAVGWLPLPSAWSAKWQAAGRVAICLALVAIAVGWAGLDFAAAQAGIASDPYSGYHP